MNTANNKKAILYKEKLKSGLLQLLAKGMEMEQITVKSICETAGVNRSTFYSHYAIPRDILNEIEAETLRNTSIYMQKISSADFNCISLFLEYIKAHDDVFRVLFLYGKDKEFLEKLIQESICSFHHLKIYLRNPSDYVYIQSFITAGSSEIINTWILGGYSESAEYIQRLIFSLSEAAIKTFT